jgi:hypothetical protein
MVRYSLLWISILIASPALADALLGVNGGSGGGFSSPGAVLRINDLSGDGTVLATPMPGLGLTGVANDSQGRVFASTGTANDTADGPRLIQIDPATGALINDVGRLQTAGGDDCFVGDLSFQPGTDVLFGVLGNQGPDPRCGIPSSGTGGYLVTIDTTTAIVTVVGRDDTLGNSNGGLAFAPNGTLYFTPCWDDPGVILELNPANAAILDSTALEDEETCYMGLAVRPSDGSIFGTFDDVNDDNSIYRINPSSGSRVLVGNPGDFLVHDLAFGAIAVSNAPALSIAGLALTLSALALIGKRRIARRSH